ncbi:(S)-2-hydroxy-acid oxidase [Fusarium albosuccineum]|uniref:(S)-2-hydroxy-acid oxidase n=1 Tax=Fusarium albosuccineum TaxID=1237068 RepID=A0A8H4KNL1_9HYPO|nr:(S)-2-hydroxy-acid oxidase [Fusarium albosuccineum]
MPSLQKLLFFASFGLAARPFLNEPDTGIEDALPIVNGTFPPLDRILGLPDFDYVARHVLDPFTYALVCHGAGSEGSYRNNLEVFDRFRFRPRVMVNITGIDASLKTSILGHEFDVPFFISPFANAGGTHESAERGLVEAAAAHEMLPSQMSTLPMEKIASFKAKNQVLWQQVSLSSFEDESPRDLFKSIEDAGMEAIVLTVDSAADRTAYRPISQSRPSQSFRRAFKPSRTLVRPLKLARQQSSCRIMVGRSLDGSPSPLEVAWEIHEQDPSIFEEVEVYADGGVRYGTDVLKFLALGARAVGLGRPFMYANLYSTDGISRAMSLLTDEITSAGANIGLADLKDVDASYLSGRYPKFKALLIS